jgi:hypothetical protein
MPGRSGAHRDLLFGLHALQNGMVNREELIVLEAPVASQSVAV